MKRSSSHLKYHRAQEHLSAFDMATQWWLQQQPHRVIEEIDAEAGFKQIVVVADEQPPMRLSLIIGDAIQNLRATLDHMVVELATEHFGEPLPSDVEQLLAFPIATSKTLFRSARRQGRLCYVPARAQAVIQRAQPYRREDDFSRHPLWVLHELSNIDKHRRLPLLATLIREVTIEKIEVSVVDTLTIEGPRPFKDKAVLVSWSPPEAQVNVDFRSVLTEIAFGEGTPVAGQPVASVVASINAYIGSIGDVLKPKTAPALAERPTPSTEIR